MTRPKRARRIGLAPRQDAGQVQIVARSLFLQAVAHVVPEVLRDLADAPDTETARAAWGARWGLSDRWCLTAAASAQHLWTLLPATRGRRWGPVSGAHWVDPTVPPHPGLLKHPEHFVWLARAQCGGVRYADVGHAVSASPATVQEACARLADLLGLTRRTHGRGRPRVS